MYAKLVAVAAAAAVALSGSTALAGDEPVMVESCVPLPVKIDSKDVHVGDKKIHVGGISKIRACVTWDSTVEATPTVTQYQDCGELCFAARLSDVTVSEQVKVTLRYSQDGETHETTVDTGPVGVSEETPDVCVSNYAEGSEDPCTWTVTPPRELSAAGRKGRIDLRWSPSSSADGHSTVAGYEVYRSSAADVETFTLIATVPEASFVDRWVRSGRTYHYYVTAIDTEGNRSSGSNRASAKAK